MKIAKNRLSIILLSLAIVVVAILVFTNRTTTPQQSRDKAWEDFKSYIATMQLPDKTPAYKDTSTMGCFNNEAARDTSLDDCTFSGAYGYELKGSYTENGQQIYALLKERGFYFADKESQQEFEQKLQLTQSNGNLSNPEPIIVELHNKNGAWVRFSLGDKGRLRTPGWDAETEQAFNGVADNDLVGILDFFKSNQ
jgi:hypothetical protein